MKRNKSKQEGQAIAIVIVIVLVVIAIGGIAYYMAKNPNPYQGNQNQPVLNVNAQGSALIHISSSNTLGQFLVAPNNMTLYYRNGDTSKTSNCTGSCATIWPPLIVTGIPAASSDVTGTLGVITRADGQMQATYNDWPLYYYSGDKKAGDTNGQGFNNIWYIVSPDVIIAPTSLPTTPTPTGTMPVINAPVPAANTNTPTGY